VILEAAFCDCSKKRVAFFFKGLEFHEDINFLGNIGDHLPIDPALHLKIPDACLIAVRTFKLTQ
jgi:hypothetical protein